MSLPTRIPLILMLSVVLINITACSSIAGNVVPQSGPSMEKVYDSMDKQKENTKTEDQEKPSNTDDTDSINQNKEELKDFRAKWDKPIPSVSFASSEFYKVP